MYTVLGKIYTCFSSRQAHQSFCHVRKWLIFWDLNDMNHSVEYANLELVGCIDIFVRNFWQHLWYKKQLCLIDPFRWPTADILDFGLDRHCQRVKRCSPNIESVSSTCLLSQMVDEPSGKSGFSSQWQYLRWRAEQVDMKSKYNDYSLVSIYYFVAPDQTKI